MRSVLESPPFPQSRPHTVPGLFAWTGEIIRHLASLYLEYGFRLNRVLPKDGSETMTHPLPLSAFTVATLPDATLWEGAIIYVSDGVAGARFRGSNGTAWVNLG